jgi:hypothetical protein
MEFSAVVQYLHLNSAGRKNPEIAKNIYLIQTSTSIHSYTSYPITEIGFTKHNFANFEN